MVALDRLIVAGVALVGLASGAASLHARATLSDVNGDIALLKREDTNLRERLDRDEAYRKAVLAKLDALCRALPQAHCPLGENER